MTTRRKVVISAAAAYGAAALGTAAASGTGLERFRLHDPLSTRTIDHVAFARFLAPVRRLGTDGIARIAYGEVSDEVHAVLKAYIAALERVTVTELNRAEQFAYWANLYNAVTLDVVLDAYPVESIRDIGGGLFSIGPWKAERVSVEGVRLSLDDIEHRILRSHWRDPRVHYALNCASLGCPDLNAVPFVAEGLDAVLDANARRFVNHPRGVRLDKRGRLSVSRIYRWYAEDFGGTERGVLVHLRGYAGPATAAMLAAPGGISGYHYDWALNDG